MLLNYRSRSETELRERLEKKGFSENHISSTLRRLKESGYLDDHALALDLKRQAFDNKLLGHNSAKRFLLNRGVPDEIIDETLEYNEETENNKISCRFPFKTQECHISFTGINKQLSGRFL